MDALRLQGGAIVTFGHEFRAKMSSTQDYGPGTCEMMEHLLSAGPPRIGFIHGVARAGLGADRLFAYRRALRAAGLPYEKQLIVQCGPNPDDGACAARRLLDLSPRPTAILGVNDLMAMGACRRPTNAGYPCRPISPSPASTTLTSPSTWRRRSPRCARTARRSAARPRRFCSGAWPTQIGRSNGSPSRQSS